MINHLTDFGKGRSRREEDKMGGSETGRIGGDGINRFPEVLELREFEYRGVNLITVLERDTPNGIGRVSYVANDGNYQALKREKTVEIPSHFSEDDALSELRFVNEIYFGTIGRIL